MDQPVTPAPETTEELDYLAGKISLLNGGGKPLKLSDVEKTTIGFHIDFHRGNMVEVAKSLGIGRSTLYRKMATYKLGPYSAVPLSPA